MPLDNEEGNEELNTARKMVLQSNYQNDITRKCSRKQERNEILKKGMRTVKQNPYGQN
jgi:hypothetical protein